MVCFVPRTTTMLVTENETAAEEPVGYGSTLLV